VLIHLTDLNFLDSQGLNDCYWRVGEHIATIDSIDTMHPPSTLGQSWMGQHRQRPAARCATELA
jgi:hypothetical protein